MILDGSKALRLNPSREEMTNLREAQIRHENGERKILRTRSSRPRQATAIVEVAANIGGLKDAGQVAELGGDGVGLLRSEFSSWSARLPQRRGAIRGI